MFHPLTDVDATSNGNDCEYERNQSAFDPLSFIPDKAKGGLYMVVVKPENGIFIPKRWWHYAVSLEPSQTIMRNWYNSKTNTQALVQMVLKSITTSSRLDM